MPDTPEEYREDIECGVELEDEDPGYYEDGIPEPPPYYDNRAADPQPLGGFVTITPEYFTCTKDEEHGPMEESNSLYIKTTDGEEFRFCLTCVLDTLQELCGQLQRIEPEPDWEV